MNTSFEIPHPYNFKRYIDWPVDIGIAAGGLLGYVIAWLGLICYLKVDHWMAGVIGSFAGWLVGWFWFRLVVKNKVILKG